MLIADFLRHTRKQGCTDNPFEGKNITGLAIEIYNPKKKRKAILQIYKNGEVSKTTVVQICTMALLIDLPEKY